MIATYFICTILLCCQSFYRRITSHEKGGGRPVVRDGNRVQDSCNILNWGALNHAFTPIKPVTTTTGSVVKGLMHI